MIYDSSHTVLGIEQNNVIKIKNLSFGHIATQIIQNMITLKEYINLLI